MKAVSLLQVIYSFFLGLVVVGLVAIGINTFHRRPPWPEYPYGKSPDVMTPGEVAEYEAAQRAATAAQDAWSLNTSIILLVCATVILAISLWRPSRMAVISNGLLLGGIFTMIYAVGQSLATSSGSVARFFVALAALVVTVGVGYLTFIRRTPSAESLPTGGEGDDVDAGELSTRVEALERRFEALGRAFGA
ncbi:MAG TPA: hypothetical protein GXZ45_08660 [Propionibacterium sp.]|nr:hypothetical protein [Propionibacterium sp.]